GGGGGTVFKINTDGNGFAVLKQFAGGNEGAVPVAGLVLNADTLYGTTEAGSGSGTVFKINTNGTGFAVLKNFTNSADGLNPSASLALSCTNLYGTTYYGGIS